MNLSDGCLKEFGRCLGKDLIESSLKDRAASNNPLAQALQSFSNLNKFINISYNQVSSSKHCSLSYLNRERVITVVNHDPAHSPTRYKIPEKNIFETLVI